MEIVTPYPPVIDQIDAGMSSGERYTCLALILLFGVYPLFTRPFIPPLLCLFLPLTLFSWLRRYGIATGLGLMSSIAVLVYTYVLGIAPLAFGLGIAVVHVLAQFAPWLRRSLAWVRRGVLDGPTLALCTISVAVAGAALVTWYALTHPNLEDLYRAFRLRDFPLLTLVGGAVIFATANAAAEEIMYRGFIMHALQLMHGWRAALILQAIAFGLLHINGFPRGWVGVGLATIYGLMMGTIRLRARGMLAPWLAHIITDLTIIGILLFTAH